MADIREYARGAARANGVDPELYVRQIGQESGFNPDAFNSASGASGIAQIIERWHPAMAGKTKDPYASLDYAAGLMAAYRRKLGSYRLALAAYNWGIGNVAGYTETDGTVVPAWDGRRETTNAETRHYLDVILGPGWPEPGETTVKQVRLSDVLERARSRIGDPYVWGGKTPPKTDCSGFVAWAYGGAIPSFTDAIFDATERVEKPAPGDLVLYQYNDPEQPGVKFPHVGIFISDTVTLDNRAGLGVGEHPQLPRVRDGGKATRYYRRYPGALVDTETAAPPPATDDLDSMDAATLREKVIGLRRAVAHLSDKVVPKAAEAGRLRDEAMEEARTIREQFVGPKP